MADDDTGNDLDLDEFLQSNPAAGMQLMVEGAVRDGVVRAFWPILWYPVATWMAGLVVGVFILAAFAL